MGIFIGGNPGAVYSEDDAVKGKCPVAGTVFEDGGGRVYKMCKVAASQNLTNGHVVTIAANHVVTIGAANAGGPTAANNIGVAVVSVTASASTFIWVQVYGPGFVQASLSALPNILLKFGSVAGNLDDDVTVSQSAHVAGIVLTATSGLAGALCAAFLTWPRFQGTADVA